MTDTTTTQGAPANGEMFPGVRMAGHHDEDALYELLYGMWEEGGLLSLSPHKVRAQIKSVLSEERGVIGVIDGPEGLEATIGLSFHPMWYTDDWSINETWLYVHPDHRRPDRTKPQYRSTHARTLIEFAKWVSGRMKMPLIMSVTQTKRTEAKMRLFRRSLVPVGGTFLWGSEFTRFSDIENL